MTVVYCDHCGKEIDLLSGYIDEEIVIDAVHINFDLCDDCMDELVNIIKNYCSNATVMKGA